MLRKFFLLLSCNFLMYLSYSQNNNKTNLTGKWEVIKMISKGDTINWTNNSDSSATILPKMEVNFTKDGFIENIVYDSILLREKIIIDTFTNTIITKSKNGFGQKVDSKMKFHFINQILILEMFYDKKDEQMILELKKNNLNK